MARPRTVGGYDVRNTATTTILISRGIRAESPLYDFRISMCPPAREL